MTEKISNIFNSILPKSSEENKSTLEEYEKEKIDSTLKDSENKEITLEFENEMTFEECQELLKKYKKICKEDDDSSPKNCTETIENLEKMCSK